MSIFKQLVDQAMRSQPNLAPLRVVAEKELLHHDILREMSRAGFLQSLTFIGGTCLRACYGSQRLSEGLDFTGGAGFTHKGLADLGRVLVDRLEVKYGLPVEVSEPQRETGNVDTWKLRVFIRPGQKHVPIQRINIDICALPSHDRKPMMLRNHYGVEMGTSGLILQAQSRDLWDIVWLNRQGITLPVQLVLQKAVDRRQDLSRFLEQLQQRILMLSLIPQFARIF